MENKYDEIRFKNGSVIRGLPVSGKNVRGNRSKYIIFKCFDCGNVFENQHIDDIVLHEEETLWFCEHCWKELNKEN